MFWDDKNEIESSDSMLQRPRSSNSYTMSSITNNLFNNITNKTAKEKSRAKTIHIYKDNKTQSKNNLLELEVNDVENSSKKNIEVLQEKCTNMKNKSKETKSQDSNASIPEMFATLPMLYSPDPLDLLAPRTLQKYPSHSHLQFKSDDKILTNTDVDETLIIQNRSVSEVKSMDSKTDNVSNHTSESTKEYNNYKEITDNRYDSQPSENTEKFTKELLSILENNTVVINENNIGTRENTGESIDDSEEEHEVLSISSELIQYNKGSFTISQVDGLTINTNTGLVSHKHSHGTSQLSHVSNYGNFQEEDLNVACNLSNTYGCNGFPSSMPIGTPIGESDIVSLKENNNEKLDIITNDYISTPMTSQAVSEVEVNDIELFTEPILDQQHLICDKEQGTTIENPVSDPKVIEEQTAINSNNSEPINYLKSSETKRTHSQIDKEQKTMKQPLVIRQKRKSKLAEICGKTNRGRAPLRVGLSKRVKIDSLHNYLNS